MFDSRRRCACWQFTGEKVARDTGLGYPVWRSWFPWENVAYVARKESPDLIVVMAIEPVRMALAAKSTKVPILMQLMDVEFKDHGGPFEDLGIHRLHRELSFYG